MMPKTGSEPLVSSWSCRSDSEYIGFGFSLCIWIMNTYNPVYFFLSPLCLFLILFVFLSSHFMSFFLLCIFWFYIFSALSFLKHFFIFLLFLLLFFPIKSYIHKCTSISFAPLAPPLSISLIYPRWPLTTLLPSQSSPAPLLWFKCLCLEICRQMSRLSICKCSFQSINYFCLQS